MAKSPFHLLNFFSPFFQNNLNQNQCVFIRGFRAKRVFLWTRLKGAAGPLPDDPDNRREDEIQVTRVPDVPSVRDFSCYEVQEHDVPLLVP